LQMTKKEFGNFSQWTLKELIEAERSFVAGDRRKAELQAESTEELLHKTDEPSRYICFSRCSAD